MMIDLATLALIKKQVSKIIDGAPEALDTLKEVADWIQSHNDELSGIKGERGESAYEIAVRYGFEGTEEEWLNIWAKKDEIVALTEQLVFKPKDSSSEQRLPVFQAGTNEIKYINADTLGTKQYIIFLED